MLTWSFKDLLWSPFVGRRCESIANAPSVASGRVRRCDSGLAARHWCVTALPCTNASFDLGRSGGAARPLSLGSHMATPSTSLLVLWCKVNHDVLLQVI